MSLYVSLNIALVPLYSSYSVSAQFFYYCACVVCVKLALASLCMAFQLVTTALTLISLRYLLAIPLSSITHVTILPMHRPRQQTVLHAQTKATNGSVATSI